jgi:WS/DGAT/MGAT family acyltransferase
MFFKLHHAVADGVGGNAIFAAMTDCERDDDPAGGLPADAKGAWVAESLGRRLVEAVRDRIALDVERVGSVLRTVAESAVHPSRVAQALAALRSIGGALRFDSHSPLKRSAAFGRARRLAGVELSFDEMRHIRHALSGTMIDAILTVMARGIGRWHREQGMAEVRELMTLVPVNLRRPEEWTERAVTGNVATGLLIPLPVQMQHPVATFREVHRRVETAKADPAARATPVLAEVLSVFGRRVVAWMGEATFGAVDFIVTNVPGILATRYVAGAEIVAAYPFAPVALQSPASIALYGYRDRLFVGIDADETVMPDVTAFQAMIVEAFEELRACAGTGACVSTPAPGERVAVT